MNSTTDSPSSPDKNRDGKTPEYIAHRVHSDVQMTADPSASPWNELPHLRINHYPWYESGKKQDTRVKACYDAHRLHLLFDCDDVHISARARQPNGDVCKDSCVEFFGSPPGSEGYFNLEINCCGDVHLGYGTAAGSRELANPAILDQINVVTTVDERPKNEAPSDDGWTLQASVSFRALTHLTGQEVCPSHGDQWPANFYRCGGETDPQFACWSPIDAPSPNFHLPDFFGVLVFGD